MLEKLRKLLATKFADMQAIVDGAKDNEAGLTAEDQALYQEYKAEVVGIRAQIAVLEEHESLGSELRQSTGTVANRQSAGSSSTGLGNAARGPEAKKSFENIGEFLGAVVHNPTDQRLHFQAASDMRSDSGSTGGFMIPEQFLDTFLQVSPQEAIIRPRATVIPAGSPPDAAISMPGLDQSADLFGGVAVTWIEEGGIKPRVDFKVNETKLEPKEMAATIVFTDKLLRNWGAGAALAEKLMRQAIIKAEDVAFNFGNGVGKPLGFAVRGLAAYDVHREVSNSISYNDIIAMDSHSYGTGKVWVGNPRCKVALRKMVDPEGHYIWQENARVGEPSTLLGYPFLEDHRSPSLGSRGDLKLQDFSYYMIKDGSGPFVAKSEHVYFESNKTVIKIFKNVDGGSWLHAPIVDEDGFSVSPCVVLDVP
jgi:HK97 family phage major capsid protein